MTPEHVRSQYDWGGSRQLGIMIRGCCWCAQWDDDGNGTLEFNEIRVAIKVHVHARPSRVPADLILTASGTHQDCFSDAMQNMLFANGKLEVSAPMHVAYLGWSKAYGSVDTAGCVSDMPRLSARRMALTS